MTLISFYISPGWCWYEKNTKQRHCYEKRKNDNTFIFCRRSPNKWMCPITKPARDCVLLKVSSQLHYTTIMSCYIIYCHSIYLKAYTCYMHAYTHTLATCKLKSHNFFLSTFLWCNCLYEGDRCNVLELTWENGFIGYRWTYGLLGYIFYFNTHLRS